MRRIKYVKSDKFFAKEYQDGIIVAFKNIGDNNSSSHADQIHQMASKNVGVDLFVSDIIESISEINSLKDSIKDSLFIYVNNGVSISACRISLCPNKDYIEVKYDSEKVLTVQKKRSKRLWWVCILFLLCICGYYTIFDDDTTPDEPNVEVHEEKANAHTPENESEPNDIAVENIAEVVETDIAQNEEGCHDVHTTDSPEYNERDRQRKALKAQANEYVRIADQAYNDYAESFNESKGIVALTNYKKALDLKKKHGLFLVNAERIEKKVNILENELKINIY